MVLTRSSVFLQSRRTQAFADFQMDVIIISGQVMTQKH